MLKTYDELVSKVITVACAAILLGYVWFMVEVISGLVENLPPAETETRCATDEFGRGC